MKPTTYEDWKHCITEICGIPLTLNYIQQRIEALNNQHDYHTQAFVKSWGPEHLQKVTDWFKQAEQELSKSREASLP